MQLDHRHPKLLGHKSALVDFESLHFPELGRVNAFCVSLQHALGGDFGIARHYDNPARCDRFKCRYWDERNSGGFTPNHEMTVEQIWTGSRKGTQCVDKTLLVSRNAHYLLVEADVAVVVTSDQLARGVASDSNQLCALGTKRTFPYAMDSAHKNAVTKWCRGHIAYEQMLVRRN